MVSLGAVIASVPAESHRRADRADRGRARTTQLVIGRSRRNCWFELRHRSVVERLVRDTEGVAVHVTPAPATRAPRRRLPRLGSGYGYAAAAVFVAVTSALAQLVMPLTRSSVIDLLYLLPVILTSTQFGRWPRLAAGLAYNFFFLPPVHTVTIADPESILAVAVLLVLAECVARMAGRQRVCASISALSATENTAAAVFGHALAQCSDRMSASTCACRPTCRWCQPIRGCSITCCSTLLANAAMHGGGPVTITAERVEVGVRLAIADRGPGLPQPVDQLFDRFTRGDTAAHGSGLGLAIARNFVDVMHWRIDARDRRDGGVARRPRPARLSD